MTIDAAGTQVEIARQIRAQGGDYLLPVKGNQPGLLEACEANFAAAVATDFAEAEVTGHGSVERAHGRTDERYTLALAAKTKPDVIVDLATLTGAARVALGASYAAVLGNDQATIDALIAAGKTVGEPLWQLPLAREYKDDIRSTIADVKNIGGSEGGTITRISRRVWNFRAQCH